METAMFAASATPEVDEYLGALPRDLVLRFDGKESRVELALRGGVLHRRMCVSA